MQFMQRSVCSCHYSRLISSKDAYMLIYTKKSSPQVQSDDGPRVPARVMKLIRDLNNEHDHAVREYNARYVALSVVNSLSWSDCCMCSLEKIKAQFLALSNRLKRIYSSWSTSLQEVEMFYPESHNHLNST